MDPTAPEHWFLRVTSVLFLSTCSESQRQTPSRPFHDMFYICKNKRQYCLLINNQNIFMNKNRTCIIDVFGKFIASYVFIFTPSFLQYITFCDLQFDLFFHGSPQSIKIVNQYHEVCSKYGEWIAKKKFQKLDIILYQSVESLDKKNFFIQVCTGTY